MSANNKKAREAQDNALHTTGSRAFAVVHDQEVKLFLNVCMIVESLNGSSESMALCLQEIKLGKRVGREELFCLTHTKKDGNPVDAFSATKIVST